MASFWPHVTRAYAVMVGELTLFCSRKIEKQAEDARIDLITKLHEFSQNLSYDICGILYMIFTCPVSLFVCSYFLLLNFVKSLETYYHAHHTVRPKRVLNGLFTFCKYITHLGFFCAILIEMKASKS